MTTLHWVYLLLLVYCLGLSSFNTSSYMELLRVGSLNMNGGRDRGKQAMLELRHDDNDHQIVNAVRNY